MSEYQLMTADQKDLCAMVHDFCAKKVDPYAAEWDEQSICPIDTVKELMDLGFWGLDVPEQYGGTELDVSTIMYIRMAMAYHDAGFANTFSAQTFGWKPVLLSGSEEQKEKYGRLLSEEGRKFWSMCITEPQSGSDAGNCKTKAVRDGDDYIITGSKCFVTNGGVSDLYTVTACTDPAKGSKGISLFIIDRNMPGVSVGKHENKMGIRTSDTTDLALDEVRVPADNMIGPEGSGFKTIMKMLSRTRPTGVAPAVGVAQRAMDLALDYSRTRLSFGAPIGKLEGIQFKLADMEMKLQACRSQLAYSAALVDQGIYDTLVGSCTKCFVSEAVLDICLQAQQIFGGYGYSKEYPLEKLVRDARIYSIYEGSSEIQRYIIGKTLVGKL
ncbi:Acyl-CoA dehydrogenase [bioreactor metagenome]|uniref:Acyl-CoA dehydrogenase n=1 Tax=bioreactor metagenome TaxID=1076179 RepID=A0A645AZ59_9ZZZZ|nr:acyl-CoA dehydrogenase family protein [Oscillibacter sp.]MEA4994532.1 acyl-CoA dehydrogenase family protein [Oscillibacter sp.]